jgi:uncharacterized protein (TIGR03435 family)
MKIVVVRLALAALASFSCVDAQTKTTPAFAAASIRKNPATGPGFLGMEFLPGGRLRIQNMPLQMIVAQAYNVPFQSSRLTGGPDWIRGERFDIEATAEPGAIPTGASPDERDKAMHTMLRALLAERFQLKIRREIKDQAVYAVVVGKGGPKLKPAAIEEKDCETDAAKDTDCHNFHGGRGRGLHAKAANVADLALFVSNWTDRPVIDRTGLAGIYQFETRGWADIAPGPAPAAGTVAEDGQDAASLPTIFTIFTGLGLKLDAQHAPVEMLVIERVERPTEN